MEGPAELSVEAVLRFLRERGGRAPHAELVQRFRGALGGDPEQRARARPTAARRRTREPPPGESAPRGRPARASETS